MKRSDLPHRSENIGSSSQDVSAVSLKSTGSVYELLPDLLEAIKIPAKANPAHIKHSISGQLNSQRQNLVLHGSPPSICRPSLTFDDTSRESKSDHSRANYSQNFPTHANTTDNCAKINNNKVDPLTNERPHHRSNLNEVDHKSSPSTYSNPYFRDFYCASNESRKPEKINTVQLQPQFKIYFDPTKGNYSRTSNQRDMSMVQSSSWRNLRKDAPSPTIKSPRSVLVDSFRDKKRFNIIREHAIKTGALYGPDAIAAVSGYGTTQSRILSIPLHDDYGFNASKCAQLSPGRVSSVQPSFTRSDTFRWGNNIKQQQVIREPEAIAKIPSKNLEAKEPSITTRSITITKQNVHSEANGRPGTGRRSKRRRQPFTLNLKSSKDSYKKANSEIQIPNENFSVKKNSCPQIASIGPAKNEIPCEKQSYSKLVPRYPSKELLAQGSNLKYNLQVNEKGDNNDWMFGKRGRMKIPQKLLSEKARLRITGEARRPHNRSTNIRNKRAKNKKRSKLKEIYADTRPKGPKIHGMVGYDDHDFYPQIEKGDIRTVILPFPQSKYTHTM